MNRQAIFSSLALLTVLSSAACGGQAITSDEGFPGDTSAAGGSGDTSAVGGSGGSGDTSTVGGSGGSGDTSTVGGSGGSGGSTEIRTTCTCDDDGCDIKDGAPCSSEMSCEGGTLSCGYQNTQSKYVVQCHQGFAQVRKGSCPPPPATCSCDDDGCDVKDGDPCSSEMHCEGGSLSCGYQNMQSKYFVSCEQGFVQLRKGSCPPPLANCFCDAMGCNVSNGQLCDEGMGCDSGELACDGTSQVKRYTAACDQGKVKITKEACPSQ